MECEIKLEKVFGGDVKDNTMVCKINGRVEFALGIVMNFYHGKELIEEHEYISEMDNIKEDFLDKSLKEKIEWLWVVYKNRLRYKLKYIKYIEGNKSYIYHGQKMFEM